MTTPITISIHITMNIDPKASEVRVETQPVGLAEKKAAMPAPADNTFHLQSFLSNKDGTGGKPGTLPKEVLELWQQFASCVAGKTVMCPAYTDHVNRAIGAKFHGPGHVSGADYMQGEIGQCVQSWLDAQGYAYTFSTWSETNVTRFSRRNNQGTWDYNNPGVHYAVRNAQNVIEAYMGIDTTEKTNP